MDNHGMVVHGGASRNDVRAAHLRRQDFSGFPLTLLAVVGFGFLTIEGASEVVRTGSKEHRVVDSG
jgi:hypothetical protein